MAMEYVYVLTIFQLFILSILFLRRCLYENNINNAAAVPSSPQTLPIFGNLHLLGKLPHRSLQNLSQKHGPLMLLRFGTRKNVLVASSAETARHVLKNNDIVFANRPKTRIQNRLLYGSKDVAFAPYGEYWRKLKSICVVQLLSNKRVQSFQHVLEEETSMMMDKIRVSSSSSSSNTIINLTDAFVTLTNDVVCRIALGRKYDHMSENGKEIMQTIREFEELMGIFDIGDYIPWLSWLNTLKGLNAKVERVAKEIDQLLERVIEEHNIKKISLLEATPAADFVDILLHIHGENMINGISIERDSVKAVIMDMFAAGTDTTHTVMEWAMSELLRNPNTLDRLQNEVRNVAAPGKLEITEENLKEMKYLKAVIKETLRLHSPVPLLARESTKKANIMGHHIPAGTLLLVNTWAIGRDPSNWKEPLEFEPERFLDSGIDFRGLDFELIPFGAGRRGCPGVAFTAAVNELALAKLVQCFNFALPNGMKPQEMDMTEANGIALHKKLPLFATAFPVST